MVMVLAPAVLGLGAAACTQGTGQSPQAQGTFTTKAASLKSVPTLSSTKGSATVVTPAPSKPPSSTPARSLMAPASNVAIGPVWPIEPRTVATAASGAGVPVLTAIRTGRHGSYERLTFEFTSPYGRADVRYVPIVHADASGKVVPLQGSSFLQVVVHGAVAHWSATPITAYTGPSMVTPNYPRLKQVCISGDFEAVLSFGIGLDRTAGFQVTRLGSPDRLVVDVAESPAWRMWPDDSLATARSTQASFDQGHMSWRGSRQDVAMSYACVVYGWNNPQLMPVPGTDTYRVTHQGSADHISVRAVPEFPTTGKASIYEIADTR